MAKLFWDIATLCFAWAFLNYNSTIAIQRYKGSAEAAVAWAYLWFLLHSLSFFQSIGIPVIPQRGTQHPGLCSVTLGRLYTFISVEFNLEPPVSWSNMLAKSALTVFHMFVQMLANVNNQLWLRSPNTGNAPLNGTGLAEQTGVHKGIIWWNIVGLGKKM
jgi:hypothetical protein